jgi:hypothetical protein
MGVRQGTEPPLVRRWRRLQGQGLGEGYCLPKGNWLPAAAAPSRSGGTRARLQAATPLTELLETVSQQGLKPGGPWREL